ncbi:hypothetical protein [Terriglobus saanensis]|uniref:Uncharacterized protein n=1 Tax=Terriglobus saanensis (strain ATCC BAA-1853 / DSM 23119 / SP1PR4) TaxID=401053 RepID=E8V2U5_TERSS|nr:hypothetical protein [Terriglobus saanensis]ADV84642.1 hypothetical protein AciPR4_3893 [Terriglobus saanensis SP1PR4]
MARVALQVKNIASLVLATIASGASGLAVHWFFDAAGKPWGVPATVLVICLGGQLALIFVESKEEEELSLGRTKRIELGKRSIELDQKIATKMQEAIDSGHLDQVLELDELRKKING